MSDIASLFVNFKFFDFDSANDSRDLFYNLTKKFDELVDQINSIEEVRKRLFGNNQNTDFFYKKLEATWNSECFKHHRMIEDFFKNDEFNRFLKNCHYVKIPAKSKSKKGNGFRLVAVVFEYTSKLDIAKDNYEGIKEIIEDKDSVLANISYYLFPIIWTNTHKD